MVKGESALTKLFLMSLQMRLAVVKKVLEHRIGVGMEELDDYLHCYRFVPETLMSMIGYYVDEADPAETGSIAPDVFLSLFKVMMLQDLQRSMSKDKTRGKICQQFSSQLSFWMPPLFNQTASDEK